MYHLIFPLQFLPLAVKIIPPRIGRWLAVHAPSRRVKKMVEVVDVMDNTSNEVFNARKQAIEKGEEAMSQQVGQGKDILSILST